jgi:hypothetical protein
MATEAQTPEIPAVRWSPPGPWLAKTLNPVVRWLLESPLRWIPGKGLAVLRVRGRKSGRTYTFPITWNDLNEEVFVLTAAKWRLNLAEGADVEITHAGQRTRKRADIVANPEAVARTYLRAVEAYGVRKAKSRVGVTVRDRDDLGFEEMAEACRRDHMVAIKLTDPK